jgi:predicted O-linked N-acetylglucosamine transferase (SPINDLY family)
MLLPHCYLPGDAKRAIGPTPTRAQCGLPDAGFVFCCFNASYKILPDVFAIWMRLLAQLPGSVLWLLETNPRATANLRREAHARGIASERLVFAPRVPVTQHLARHAAADLFLDTFPCNAHTTANDALYAGLPIVTCSGETFASRVSGSQLRALGLPELVTESLIAYEALVLEMARQPERLARCRERVRSNRDSSSLFDTAGYTRALESLLLAAWEALPGTRSDATTAGRALG